MTDFKVGDIVEMLVGDYADLNIGDRLQVVEKLPQKWKCFWICEDGVELEGIEMFSRANKDFKVVSIKEKQ